MIPKRDYTASGLREPSCSSCARAGTHPCRLLPQSSNPVLAGTRRFSDRLIFCNDFFDGCRDILGCPRRRGHPRRRHLHARQEIAKPTAANPCLQNVSTYPNLHENLRGGTPCQAKRTRLLRFIGPGNGLVERCPRRIVLRRSRGLAVCGRVEVIGGERDGQIGRAHV